MRDLLFLCQRIPYPPNKGEKIRAFRILDHLSRDYRIHLGCFIDDPAEEGRVGGGNHPQRLKVAGASGLYVERARGRAGEPRIDRKFVRTRM